MDVDPRTLKIVYFPHPVLRTKAKPIERIDQVVRDVGERMIELMYEAEGIGLAAPQVGLPWRMFVCHVPSSPEPAPTPSNGTDADLPDANAGPEVYINPTITEPHGLPELMEEGCLSLPRVRGDLMRQPDVTLTWSDLDGTTHTRRATGLLARCWQHENDHLDGVLIIDRFTQLSRMRTRSALRALEKQGSS